MIFHAHATERFVLDPINLWAEVGRTALAPWVKLHPAARATEAGLEVLGRFTRGRRHPNFDLDVRDKVIVSRPFAQLRHFPSRYAHVQPLRYLLLAPLSGHHATLLRPTVDALLDTGEVFLVEWRCASEVPAAAGSLGYDDYVDELRRFMGVVAGLGDGRFHAIAACQPGPQLVAALTVQQLEGDRARPDGITVIAAPMDPAAAPTQVSALAAESGARGLPPNAVQRVGLDRPGAGREVVPGLVQLWSMLFQAPSEHLARHWRLVGRRISGDHAEAEALAEFYDRYVAVIDLDAALYRETLRRVFTERELAAGRATWRGRALDPSGIRDVGVQTIEGGADDICAPGQTRAAHAILSGVPKTLRDHLEVPELSHYATFAGRRFRAQVLPRVAAFAYACRDGG